MSRRHAVLTELGALLGLPEPAEWATRVIDSVVNPCQHYGEWVYDPDEICPEPCGQRHEWCRACGRPMKPECAVLTVEAL